MDQGPLVAMQLEDGQRLLDRLAAEGVEVTAAFWAKESEYGEWYLYLVTPLVGENGVTRAAYRRVIAVTDALRRQGFEFDPFEVKAIGPSDPIAKAAVAARDRSPGRRLTRFRGSRLGELDVEEAYIYPPMDGIRR
jgi:hypothetical protein